MNNLIYKYSKLEKINNKKKINIFSYFKPILFKKLNSFNLNTKKISELFEFTDIHHPARFSLNMKNGGIRKFNKQEKNLKALIEEKIFKIFKKKKNINDSFSRAVISSRFIINNFEKSSILEIGPGTGYLGCLLIKNNFIYSSFEITKPHFLFQNIIFKKVLNNKSPISILKKNYDHKIIKKRGFHLPWWEINNIENFMNIIKPKLIIFNHVLNEMNSEGLKYLLKNINKLKNKPIIFIEGFGSENINSTEKSLKILYSKNFKIFYHKPIVKYNIAKTLSIPITLLSNKNKSVKINYINFKGFFSLYGIKKIFLFLCSFGKIKFNFYHWIIFFLDFIIIAPKKND